MKWKSSSDAGSSLSTRLHSTLLKVLIPTLGKDYAAEAGITFSELEREARDAGLGSHLAFLGKELRSLLSTAARERKGRKKSGSRGVESNTAPSAGSGGPNGSGSRSWLSAGLDTLSQDVRYAFRNLSRSPGFVTVSVLSLTFGIAISTGLFSVVNAALLRPLPHAEEPEQLVRIFSTDRGSQRGPISFPDYEDIRDASGLLQGLAVSSDRNMILGAATESTRQVWGKQVSENYFDVLGISMARGRGFLPEDIVSGQKVAIIGHHIWQDHFDSDPDVLGQMLYINGQPHSVVGVGPKGMVGFQGPAFVEVVVPITEHRDTRGRWSNLAVGRMNDGVTIEQVQAELDAVATRLVEEHPRIWDYEGSNPSGLRVMTPMQAMLPGENSFVLAAAGFLSVVGLILLIACSNVANLLLTRALKRREEVAIRSAIGASSRRIMGQLLTENLILFGLAGGLSILLIHWLASLAAAGAPFLPPGQVDITVDVRVVAFTIGLVMVAGLTFGLVPVLQASRPNLITALKGREAPPKFRTLGVRNLLVGAQVGGSLVLVLVTFLLMQSLSHARTLELGFEPRGVAVVEFDLTHGGYEEAEGRQFLTDLGDRVASMPGVTSTAIATGIPLQGGSMRLGGLEPEGYEAGPNEFVRVGMNVASPGYLELMGIRLLRGRDFSEEDVAGGEGAILVSQSFVDRYWPGEGGVGKRIDSGDDSSYRVVGVVEDIPWNSPGQEAEPFIWLPFSQHYDQRVVLHAQTSGDLGALLGSLREQVADLNSDLPIILLDRMESVTANATKLHRVLSLVLGIAGAVTMGLAMLGIYGVVAFSVSQRTREVGLRVALGAEPRQVVRMIVREGIGLAMIGLVPGVILSLVAAQVMRASLMGLSPMDPVAFGGGVGLLLLSVVGASLAPALRASRSHPMEALRED